MQERQGEAMKPFGKSTVIATIITVLVLGAIQLFKPALLPVVFQWIGIVLAACLVFFLVMFVLIFIMRRKLGKLRAVSDGSLPALYDDCDPPSAAAQVRHELEAEGDEKKRRGLTLQLAACMHAGGEYEQVVEALQQLPLDETDAAGLFGCANTLHQLALAQLRLGRLEQAEENAQRLGSYRHAVRVLPGGKNLERLFAQSYLEPLDAAFALQNGEFQRALTFYEARYPKAVRLYGQVELRYLTALALEGLGRAEEARTHFTFVAEHGNKTAFAIQARQKLGLMPEESVDGAV